MVELLEQIRHLDQQELRKVQFLVHSLQHPQPKKHTIPEIDISDLYGIAKNYPGNLDDVKGDRLREKGLIE